jgi:hypothetical protein
MKILYVGANKGNSKNNFKSLKKIYPKTKILDTSRILNKLEYAIFYHIAPNLFNNQINNFYKNNITEFYDIIFFMNEQYINEKSLKTIKQYCNKTLFYCADNPFVSRDKYRWSLVKRIISKFDLVLFHQRNREKYVKKYKIKNYLTILPPYYKNIQQFKKKINNKKKNIVFIGKWFPERGKFFYELKKNGLEVDIYGLGWNKDKKYYKYLSGNIVNKFLSQKQVAATISKYKIAIGLLSTENYDDITRRTIEIPATGTLLCSERTSTIKKILIENKEAIYFDDTNECVKKCNDLLNSTNKLLNITKNGNNKITKILKPEAERVFKKVINNSNFKKNTNKFIYKF